MERHTDVEMTVTMEKVYRTVPWGQEAWRTGPRGEAPGLAGRQREWGDEGQQREATGKAGHAGLGSPILSNCSRLWGQGLPLAVWYLAVG